MKLKAFKQIRIIVVGLMFVQIPILIAGTSSLSSIKEYSALLKNSCNTTTHTASEIYESMQLAAEGLSSDAFQKAWQGYQQLSHNGELPREDIITIADFSKPSSEKRLFIIDLLHKKVVFKSLVAHGKNSGQLYANSFSNQPETNKSSLGFFLTLNSYNGENGFSLRLKGLEKNINDKAYERAIVMHGAPYVSENKIRQQGFLGRSLGCPAVPASSAKNIIKTIKNGSLIFIYHPSSQYVKQSQLI
jgi:hypothetical protein